VLEIAAVITKLVAKKLGFRIAYYIGLMHLFSFVNRDKVLILVYHRISAADSSEVIHNSRPNQLSADRFAKQIEYLVAHRRIVPLTQVIDTLKGRYAIPHYATVITFDDGYRSIFAHAWPVLRSKRIPITIFLSTGWLENQEMLWFDKIEHVIEHARLPSIELEIFGKPCYYSLRNRNDKTAACTQIKQLCKSVTDNFKDEIIGQLIKVCGNHYDTPPSDGYKPLSWDEVREMNQSGFISFGAHGHNHRILSRIPREAVWEEVLLSKQKIEKNLGQDIRFFAYPNGKVGDFNEQTKDVLKQMDFVCGLSNVPGVNNRDINLFELRRICIDDNGDYFDFVARVSGLAAFLYKLETLFFRRNRCSSSWQHFSPTEIVERQL
jgi:peptidoglycan/xylan/chitin deacetylase (PgdA/CDA1 family)